MHLRFGTVSIRRLAREARVAARRATGAGDLAVRAGLARLLPPGPASPAACRRPQLQARVRPHPLGARPPRRRALRRLVRGPHRLPAGRRGDGADQPDRLHAQPAAHGRRPASCARTWASTGAAAKRYFAEHLNDYELAANNGGWQWAASTGCDAQPWFRIFNPVTPEPQVRSRRAASSAATCRSSPRLPTTSDPRAVGAARPIELEAAGVALGHDYPRPIVDHAEAREKTLARYAVVRAQGGRPLAEAVRPRPRRRCSGAIRASRSSSEYGLPR